jgi:transposase-like protein
MKDKLAEFFIFDCLFIMTKYCPKCGSSNIDWIIPQDRSKWICKDCGYIGALIIEDGELAEEIRKRKN